MTVCLLCVSITRNVVRPPITSSRDVSFTIRHTPPESTYPVADHFPHVVHVVVDEHPFKVVHDTAPANPEISTTLRRRLAVPSLRYAGYVPSGSVPEICLTARTRSAVAMPPMVLKVLSSISSKGGIDRAGELVTAGVGTSATRGRFGAGVAIEEFDLFA